MRRLLAAACLLLAAAIVRADDQPRPATADEVALLKAAMKNTGQDTEHWAYTETTTVKTAKGRDHGETVTRFDPSKPYAEQFTPIKIKGKPPTAKELKEARERGEKRGERVARAAQRAKDPTYVAPPAQLRMGGSNVTPDLEHPLVLREEAGHITFELPVKGTQKGIPFDKFLVLITVSRPDPFIENVSLAIRESFRVKLIAKIKAGEMIMTFTRVDPNYPPLLTSMNGDFDVSLLFIPVSGTMTRTRTEWKRVKSYDERLQVKIGPLQLMDF